MSDIRINGMIKIDRLFKYIPEDFEWNMNERVNINDIPEAIKKGQSEEKECFNPDVPMKYEWHMGRILYFINHPEEIENIEIINLNDGYENLPTVIIKEGYHRFFAAVWLFKHNKIEEIYCKYRGRSDIFYYLNGTHNRKPSKRQKKTKDIEVINCCIVNENKEFYYTFTNNEVLFTTDIRKAKKLSKSTAENLLEMYEKDLHVKNCYIIEETLDDMPQTFLG